MNEAVDGRTPSAAKYYKLGWAALSIVAVAAASITARDWVVGTPGRQGHAIHMAGAAPSIEAQGARPATKPTLVSCEKLANVPGKSLTTVLVHFPPDGYSPRHRHAGSVMAYVLKGSVRSQLNGGAIGTFKAGESFFEPPGTIHTFAENASKTEPAELLATFVADDCAQLTTYLD